MERTDGGRNVDSRGTSVVTSSAWISPMIERVSSPDSMY